MPIWVVVPWLEMRATSQWLKRGDAGEGAKKMTLIDKEMAMKGCGDKVGKTILTGEMEKTILTDDRR